MKTALVVALDGPSGSGKSSTARGVADRLSLAFLDTGAMYRAMTWALLKRGVDVNDPDAVAAAAEDVHIVSGTNPLAPSIEADGVDVAEPIRTDEITAAVSAVAAVPRVRELMVEQQRAIIAASRGIVVEGRDIGSAVAPCASVKIYLVADPLARAVRRAAENAGADEAATQVALAARDLKDSTRATSPLAKADGAIVIDSTFLTLDEVIDQVVALVGEAR
ncbi:MAG: (d)CMP kinase [Actinomycetota bacterium]|nr:(d)CMP kinase [Actinomycetota bacterium]